MAQWWRHYPRPARGPGWPAGNVKEQSTTDHRMLRLDAGERRRGCTSNNNTTQTQQQGWRSGERVSGLRVSSKEESGINQICPRRGVHTLSSAQTRVVVVKHGSAAARWWGRRTHQTAHSTVVQSHQGLLQPAQGSRLPARGLPPRATPWAAAGTQVPLQGAAAELVPAWRGSRQVRRATPHAQALLLLRLRSSSLLVTVGQHATKQRIQR